MNIILEEALKRVNFINSRYLRIPPSEERDLEYLLKLGLDLESPMTLTDLPEDN